MKKILLFALLAGVACAIAIYLASSNDTYLDDDDYVSDADIDAFDLRENNGPVKTAGDRGFHAMS